MARGTVCNLGLVDIALITHFFRTWATETFHMGTSN